MNDILSYQESSKQSFKVFERRVCSPALMLIICIQHTKDQNVYVKEDAAKKKQYILLEMVGWFGAL